MRTIPLMIALWTLAPLTLVAEEPSPAAPAAETPVAVEATPPAAATKLETFTLADGRTLTGTYDDATEDILVPGPLAFCVHADSKSIVSRRAATADEIAAVAPAREKKRVEKTPEEKAKDEERRKAAQAKAADDEKIAAEHRRAKADLDKRLADLAKAKAKQEEEARRLKAENDRKNQARPPERSRD